jgi:hypothetical protein
MEKNLLELDEEFNKQMRKDLNLPENHNKYITDLVLASDLDEDFKRSVLLVCYAMRDRDAYKFYDRLYADRWFDFHDLTYEYISNYYYNKLKTVNNLEDKITLIRELKKRGCSFKKLSEVSNLSIDYIEDL